MGHTTCFSAPSFSSLGTGSWHLSPSTSLLHQHPEPLRAIRALTLQAWDSCVHSLFLQVRSLEPFTWLAQSCVPRAAGSNTRLCSPSLHKLWADIPGEDHSPHKTAVNHGNNRKFAPGPIIQTLCTLSSQGHYPVHRAVCVAWPLLTWSIQTHFCGRKKYEAHTHTRTHAHTNTCTHIPQALIWTPARAGNGGSRKEIIVATSQVLCADRPWWFYWFHCGECGLGAPWSVVCSPAPCTSFGPLYPFSSTHSQH